MLARKSIFLAALILLFWKDAFCQSQFAQDIPVITKEEAYDLLPLGPDMLDDQMQSDFLKLIELGASAHPALSELLAEADNHRIITTIFAVFAYSKENNSIAIDAIKETLNRHGGEGSGDLQIQRSASTTLAAIGGPDEAPMLFRFLSSENEFLRLRVLRSLGRIGDSRAREQIQRTLDERRLMLNEEEQQKDHTLKEGMKAIAAIKQRESGQ